MNEVTLKLTREEAEQLQQILNFNDPEPGNEFQERIYTGLTGKLAAALLGHSQNADPNCAPALAILRGLSQRTCSLPHAINHTQEVLRLMKQLVAEGHEVWRGTPAT